MPTLLAAVSVAADPSWRARGMSIHRCWRDLGTALGALTDGLLAPLAGIAWTIAAVIGLIFLSGPAVAVPMRGRG